MEDRHSREATFDLYQSISSTIFFHGLPQASLEKATRHVVMRNHPPNQVILLENDWGGSVYFILEGWVKIRTYNQAGKEVTLNIIGPGELFGEMAAIDRVPRSTDVMSLTSTKIASIPAQDFIELIRSEPLAGVRLTQLMAKRLRLCNRQLRLREADSISRVADILLFLVEGQGKTLQQGIEIPNLSHRELSNLSGLARETVTRVLTKLERRGLIRRKQHILCIPDVSALEEIVA
ncbi:MAG: hypothetical protein BRC44_09190 [Cyanobacteria bacterium QS_4_48_99]|nr:MAG: hypothetical protein BRC44_09190 [Cyanobacteria bacterium QS_4_48_99]